MLAMLVTTPYECPMRFILPSYQHQWIATTELLATLNQKINTDAYLSNYANPNEQAQRNGQSDQTRGGRADIENIEFPVSGGFQIIFDWLVVQISEIKLQNNKFIKQITPQQRTIPNGYGGGTMWFAAETWSLISQKDATVVIHTNQRYQIIDRSHYLRDSVCDVIGYAKSMLKNSHSVQSYKERQTDFRAYVSERIEQLGLEQPARKDIQDIFKDIAPINIVQGHGKLENKTFKLTELSLSYPNQFQNNRFFDFLYRREPIDLRPEIVKSPLPHTLKKVMGHEQNSPTTEKEAHQDWWQHIKVSNLSCLATLNSIRLQVKNSPLWQMGALILLGLMALIAIIHILQISIVSLIAHKGAAILFSIYALALFFTWSSAKNHADKSLTTLPQKHHSSFAKTYERSSKFSNPSSINSVDSDTEVVDFTKVHGVNPGYNVK